MYIDIRIILYVNSNLENFSCNASKKFIFRIPSIFFHYWTNIFVKKRSIRSGGSRGLHKRGGGELIIFSVGKAPRLSNVAMIQVA